MRPLAVVMVLFLLAAGSQPARAQTRPDDEAAYRRATELRNAGIGATCGGAAAAGLGAGFIVAANRLSTQDRTGKEEGSGLFAGLGYLFAVAGAAGLVTGVVLWVSGERERGRIRALRLGRVALELDARGLHGTF